MEQTNTIAHIYNNDNSWTTFCGIFFTDLKSAHYAIILHNLYLVAYKQTFVHRKCDTCWNHPTVQMELLAKTEL